MSSDSASLGGLWDRRGRGSVPAIFMKCLAGRPALCTGSTAFAARFSTHSCPSCPQSLPSKKQPIALLGRLRIPPVIRACIINTHRDSLTNCTNACTTACTTAHAPHSASSSLATCPPSCCASPLTTHSCPPPSDSLNLSPGRPWTQGRDRRLLPPPSRSLSCSTAAVPLSQSSRLASLHALGLPPHLRLGCPLRGHLRNDDKVDSSQEIVASSGALQNITSYLNGTLANLSTVWQDSSDYISETLGIPPSLVYSSLAVLVAVPLTMSRYGWSSSREQISPYTSITGGVPAVTDEDFSYITSQELDDATDPRYFPRSASAAPPVPEDDVLLIKNKGVTWPAKFPAYTIGDGKLRVKDVRKRVGIMMDLSERGTRRVKLLYKGRQLKDPVAPIRDYGVKNNSELMAVIPDIDDGSSPSEEEMVIVDAPARDEGKSRRKKKKRSKKGKADGDGDSLATSSPRESNSTFEAPRSPAQHPRSPAPRSPPVAVSGPMKQLDELSDEFNSKWLPMCLDFVAAPSSDPKKREDEHRKVSEMVMQQVILKLDSVDSEGIPEVRARRKELVTHVQATLKRMDAVKGP
ncbi:hypothetical protein G7046_g496 [Stylonectria norvegica]|nr:hypothetical protein G7046_g496 [Stylonectria norvegica]